VTAWPRSLLWRTFLLIAVLLLVSQIAGIAIFRAVERGPRASQLAQQIATIVNLTRAALVSADPQRRIELLQELSLREGIRVYPPEHEEAVIDLPDQPLLNRIASELQRELGPETHLKTEQGGVPGLWVSFRLDEEEYWIVMPRARIERQLPWTWVGWGSLSALLSLATAWLIVSRINRPLRALTRASADLGRGTHPEPVPEAGPTELRTLAGAFNRMTAALKHSEAERALLLAGVSHDLRTPLARMRLSVEMMGGADEAMASGMIQDIEDMDAIIEQFLDFARDATGEPLDPALDLDLLARTVAERYVRRGKPVSAHPGGVAPLPLRPLAMQRLIVNLVDNALRYAQSPVEIETHAEPGRAIVSVLDRGPGIPPEHAERLMQPFTRLDPARSGGSGAGLGLAIVDRLARLHAGTVELRPRPGGGLEARVTLPVRPA